MHRAHLDLVPSWLEWGEVTGRKQEARLPRPTRVERAEAESPARVLSAPGMAGHWAAIREGTTSGGTLLTIF